MIAFQAIVKVDLDVLHRPSMIVAGWLGWILKGYIEIIQDIDKWKISVEGEKQNN